MGNVCCTSSATTTTADDSPRRPPRPAQTDDLHEIVGWLDILLDVLKDQHGKIVSSSDVIGKLPPSVQYYTSKIETFLKGLHKENKVTIERVAKDTFLPLIKEIFGGIQGFGVLKYFAMLSSLMVWAATNHDKTKENPGDCRAILHQTIFLLIHTKENLLRSLDSAHRFGSEDIISDPKMEMELDNVIILAFRAAVICVSFGSPTDWWINR